MSEYDDKSMRHIAELESENNQLAARLGSADVLRDQLIFRVRKLETELAKISAAHSANVRLEYALNDIIADCERNWISAQMIAGIARKALEGK